MALDHTKVEHLVSLVKQQFPGWAGVTDSAFVADEITYKRQAHEKAVGADGLLTKVRMRQLIHDNAFSTVIENVRKICSSSNLLYMATPSTSDIAALVDDKADKQALCDALFDLLHSEDPSEQRLGSFADFCETNGLRNKWPLPTYLLFVCRPDEDIIVKPERTKQLLELLEVDLPLPASPTAESYRALKTIWSDLLEALKPYGATDLIDAQSIVWVATSEATAVKKRRDELAGLIEECVAEYPQTPDGQTHIAMFSAQRDQGRRNYEQICAKADRGENITEAVLRGLLPHSDTPAHREGGYWIHMAPVIYGTLQSWREKSQDYAEIDWTDVATTFLSFIRRCVDHPEQLAEACADFAANPASKGFAQGMVTPILNAVRPEELLLVNGKPRRVVNYFGGHSSALLATR
jgi:hypothetical protein